MMAQSDTQENSAQTLLGVLCVAFYCIGCCRLHRGNTEETGKWLSGCTRHLYLMMKMPSVNCSFWLFKGSTRIAGAVAQKQEFLDLGDHWRPGNILVTHSWYKGHSFV
jgi:hypothetical protein